MLHALCTIPTLPLLYIRTVNHRFRNLVERIVHNRLVVAALLTDWKLIVECYHPSSQYSEPYVFCEYLGTPDLSSDAAWQPTMDSSQSSGPRKGLKGLLGRFRPTLKTPEIMITHSHLAGDVSGSRTMESNSSPRPSEEEPVVRRVNLDSHENFSQLMFSASLVQIGPRKGVFLALADVLERKTIRIFRDWLGRKAHAALKKEANAQHELLIEEAQEENSVGREAELVWVDESTKIAGLEIEVRELRWSRDMPILLSRDEDQALGYSLELRGASALDSVLPKFLTVRRASC